MRVVSLTPLSKRAKQIVKQHGPRWQVVERRQGVLFSDKPGPWLLVQPVTEEGASATNASAAQIDSAMRWVHEFNGDDFKVAS